MVRTVIKLTCLATALITLMSALSAAPVLASTVSEWVSLAAEDFEDSTVGESPEGWTATPTADCIVTSDQKHGGEKGILLENTSNSDAATISFNITEPITDENARVEFYAWFNLIELDDTGYGLKFSIKDNKNNKISSGGYFTDTGKGWRKGYCVRCEYQAYETVGATFTIMITLDGIGKVYLDDLSCGISRGRMTNGDFEAEYSEGNPGDNDRIWYYNATGGWEGNSQYITLAKEDNGNTYVKLMKTPTSSKFRQRFCNLEYNQMYKVRYRTWTNSTNNANAVSYEAGATGTPSNSINTFDSIGRVWSPACKDKWTWHEVYFVNQRNFKAGAAYNTDISFSANVGSDTGEAGFDDITIEAVNENLEFTRNGNVIDSISEGEVTVTYIYPEVDFVNSASKTLVFAVYRIENNIETLYSYSIRTDKAPGKTANGSSGGTKVKTGFLPLEMTYTLDVPKKTGNENYIVKAYVWNDILKPSSLKLNLK